MTSTTAICLLAKAPIPGFAKTRLIPALGPAGAARLQRDFCRSAVQTALDARLGPVVLWCAPDAGHRFFRSLCHSRGIRCEDQPEGDLGERIDRASRCSAAPGPVLIAGTDCPALRPSHLREAAAALHRGVDAVFIPAEDGGYVLVGLRQPQPALFADMTWSTDRVMADTRTRARSLGLRTHELAPLWDVDVPADLDRLAALAPDARSPAARPAPGETQVEKPEKDPSE
ncbi:MAG: TIGR04282 family arsenosugar biosynthesis glycosyltransferase [Gammaproteobacteria bacterium]|nr:TIGR04282 family arsenosugar biosynthesis glycosyltransferase [Gammaproteobacteria bacterium]MBU2286412.1 TIGR04282 family arsenosugar biosynthesis glycosyltransferase [Gammaproteobacteria bacterium]